MDDRLQPVLVRASAGTGKTYRLTARLLRLLLQGATPESVLATTFTRKAAGQITDSLLVTLAKAADEKNDTELQKLREQLDRDSLTPDDCLRLLDSLLRNIHRLRICTLDSLFSQLARSFPFELSLPPAWRLTDEMEEVWFRERAVDAMIASLNGTEMLSVLSMLGKGEVKRSVARELLSVVNAAYTAGRGCDSDVWSKMVVNKLPTNADIELAIEALQSAAPTQKTVIKVLAKMVEALENRDFGSLEGETLIVNIAKARRSRSEVKFGRSKLPPGLDEALDTLYAAARSHCLALLNSQNKATGAVLELYDHQVTQMKMAARTIGFDDVAFRLAAQFGSLDPATLANRMDGSIDHILLDEFQDTSPVQWQVLRPLAQRVCDYRPSPDARIEDQKVERSFFCVGDTKQAIYGWRGGVAEIFDAVADQLPGVIDDELKVSYRSSPVVIDFVNGLFPRIGKHPKLGSCDTGDLSDKDFHITQALHRFAKNFPKHETAMEFAGYVGVETADTGDGADESATFQRAANLAAEIHAAAPGKEIGILTRSNKGVGTMIRMLEPLGLDVSQEGGNPLTDSAAVELILSALMMSEHPGDKRWSYHTMASPLADIPGFSPESIRDRVTDRGLAETVESLADGLASCCDSRDTIRLKQLVHLAIHYETNAGARVRDFVRTVQEKRIERPTPAKIRVMTVHQSKGLEFDAVILPELEGPLGRIEGQSVAQVSQPGDPPTALSRYIGSKLWHFLSQDWQRAFGSRVDQSMTEAICLLYVAITRARHSLHIIIQPASKKTFENKNAAALVFHALNGDGDPNVPDPNVPGAILYQSGDPDWYRDEST